jgi:hypothetical protein
MGRTNSYSKTGMKSRVLFPVYGPCKAFHALRNVCCPLQQQFEKIGELLFEIGIDNQPMAKLFNFPHYSQKLPKAEKHSRFWQEYP